MDSQYVTDWVVTISYTCTSACHEEWYFDFFLSCMRSWLREERQPGILTSGISQIEHGLVITNSTDKPSHVMEKIVTADQEQVDKYETDSTSNITDFDNPVDDDEYPLSSHGKKKSIAIHKSRIGKNITNLGFQSKINSLLNTKTKQTRFFRRSSDCQASRRSVVLIGWLTSSSCHHKCNQLYRWKKIKWIFLGYPHVKNSKVQFCCKIKLDAFSLIPVECREIKELKKDWFAAIKVRSNLCFRQILRYWVELSL